MIVFLFRGWRLLVTVLVVLASIVLAGFGVWQVRRLNERLATIDYIQSRISAPAVPLDPNSVIDPDALDYRHVELRGTFEPVQEILRRNRAVNGVTGFHIVTPFRLSGSDNAVLVDRGWIPYDQSSPEQRQQFAPPTGVVAIDAVVQKSQDATTTPFDPPVAPGERLDAWFRINVGRIQQQVDMPLLPVFVEQQQTGDQQTLPIKTITVPPGQGNHLSYAIQWFSFSVILIVAYLAVSHQQWKRLYPTHAETIGSPRPASNE